MKDVSVAMIRDFVSCKADDLEIMAKRYSITTPSAKAIREHWIPRFSGRCIRCNGFLKQEKCGKCGTMGNSTEGTIELLVKIKAGSPLIRRQCYRCQKQFMYRAGFVLEKIKKFGNFVPANVCHQCKKSPKKEEVPEPTPEPKAKKLPAPTPPPKAKKILKKKKEPEKKKPEIKKLAPPPEVEAKVVVNVEEISDPTFCSGDLPQSLRQFPFQALKTMQLKKP